VDFFKRRRKNIKLAGKGGVGRIWEELGEGKENMIRTH